MRRLRWLGIVLCATLLAASPGTAPAIVGGEDADLADWPFLVAVVNAERRDDFRGQFCAGSLIAQRAVLTAAHCLGGGALEVVGGKATLTARGGQTAAVLERRLPPGYDAVDAEPDLALLVLDRPLALPVVAVAGPLETALTAPGRRLESAGWGLVGFLPRERFADDLQEASLGVLPDWACAIAHGSLWIPRTQFCAGNRDAWPDTCEGDSGGPVVARLADGAPRLVGVVAYGGERCGLPDEPGVYARTTALAAWIAREATRAQLVALGRVEPPALSVRERDAIELRWGARDCPAVTRCYVDVRTRGPVDRLGGGLRLRVREYGAPAGVVRFARFDRVSLGHWRAWTNLPYGEVELRAYGVDASGALAAPPLRDLLEITGDDE